MRFPYLNDNRVKVSTKRNNLKTFQAATVTRTKLKQSGKEKEKIRENCSKLITLSISTGTTIYDIGQLLPYPRAICTESGMPIKSPMSNSQ